ncbi:hypothetical protein J4444_02210 [Candidatus Woesearchaeota archaeon]|nr:hypothetical protein [Candidatus Woesearchaeota archaeon]
MAGRVLVVDHLKLSYEGLFNAGEVYSVISTFFFEKGYDWREELNEEQITSEGKQVALILRPWKQYSDYFKSEMAIRVNFLNLKEVEVEREGETLKLQHGLVRIRFDGYIIADRSNEWNTTPIRWAFNFLANLYFYSGPRRAMVTWVKADVNDLHNKIKNYLNVFKYHYEA